MISVERMTVQDVFSSPQYQKLVTEYEAESKTWGLPDPDAEVGFYESLEARGSADIFGAFSDEILAGFIVSVTVDHPKYKAPLTSIESFFVAKEFRAAGTGKHLLDAVESTAKAKNAIGVTLGAPVGGALERVAGVWGYKKTQSIAFKPNAEFDAVKSADRLAIPAMTEEQIDRIFEFEKHLADNFPAEPVTTHVVIHGGMCARTVYLRAGTAYTGSVIKVPSVITLCGDCMVNNGDSKIHVKGYNTFPAAAHRKQALIAIGDTVMTMTFATQAKTLEEAEAEAVEDVSALASNNGVTHAIITGD